MSDNQNNNPKGIIIGMLCLIWGLGSIAAMLFCSKLENHTGILLVLLGQFFLVIGLIAVICNRKAKPYPFIVLVFPLAGIALLVCGIYILTKGEIALSMLDQYAPYILIWIFPLAGIMMIAGTLWKIRYLKQVCTQEVQAKCVDIESASAAGTQSVTCLPDMAEKKSYTISALRRVPEQSPVFSVQMDAAKLHF